MPGRLRFGGGFVGDALSWGCHALVAFRLNRSSPPQRSRRGSRISRGSVVAGVVTDHERVEWLTPVRRSVRQSPNFEQKVTEETEDESFAACGLSPLFPLFPPVRWFVGLPAKLGMRRCKKPKCRKAEKPKSERRGAYGSGRICWGCIPLGMRRPRRVPIERNPATMASRLQNTRRPRVPIELNLPSGGGAAQ
jgi:hypothetical protein